MGLKEDLKYYISLSGMTIKDIQDKLNELNNTNFVAQNLNKKINNETIRYNELLQIADIIGYEIRWIKKISPSASDDEYSRYMKNMNNAVHSMMYLIQQLPKEAVENSLINGNIDLDRLEVQLSKMNNNNNNR